MLSSLPEPPKMSAKRWPAWSPVRLPAGLRLWGAAGEFRGGALQGAGVCFGDAPEVVGLVHVLDRAPGHVFCSATARGVDSVGFQFPESFRHFPAFDGVAGDVTFAFDNQFFYELADDLRPGGSWDFRHH